ncbi:hypothetical protein D9611_010084 [Ephemerocybe angulata]|uniref:Uncharacterized protein n=1 Tax=Ephemerocybe angulata TaxID=980116 RepID=A0A8H5EVA6_9AGAR|nr:hypothetical protein D9611_010084 [Tulosesus angulatus]
MRLSLIALVPLTALLSVVRAHRDYTYEAREHIDELATRAFDDSLLTTRQDLADLPTRDLLNELEDRLQRRVKKEKSLADWDQSKRDTLRRWIQLHLVKGRYYCIECGSSGIWYSTQSKALNHIKENKSHVHWLLNGDGAEVVVLPNGELRIDPVKEAGSG